MNFLKNFAIGLAYIILSPFLLLAIALTMVYGAVDFLVEFIIMMVNFFGGSKELFPVFPEDEEAYRRKQEALAAQNTPAPQPVPQPNPTNVTVQQFYYTPAGAPQPMTPPMTQIKNDPTPMPPLDQPSISQRDALPNAESQYAPVSTVDSSKYKKQGGNQ